MDGFIGTRSEWSCSVIQNMKSTIKNLKIKKMKKRNLGLLLVSIGVGIYVGYVVIGILTQNIIPYLTKCSIDDNIDGTISLNCDLTALGGAITDIGIGAVIALLLFKIQTDQSDRLTKVSRSVTEKVYARKVEYYTCDIMFDEPEGTNPTDAERIAREKAQKLVDEIKHDATRVEKITIEGRGEALHLTLKEGIIKITLPTVTRQNYGIITQSSRIHIQCTDFALLDKILSVKNRPYWDLQWHVSPKYDVHNLITKIREATGKTPSSKSGSGVGEKIVWGLASYPITEENRSIVITITESYISLTNQSKSINGGFYKAHKIFLPEKLIAILFGEVPLEEIREMIKQSNEP